MRNFDAIVIGAGMVGPAIAYGLNQQGLQVAVLDEGDSALRAARGNFGLVWFQGKGLGMPRYTQWTHESTQLWPQFHADLHSKTGLDTGYRKTGGLDLSIGEAGLAKRRQHIDALRAQSGNAGYECEFIDVQQVRDLLPGIELGDEVLGGSWSPHDGHANPLMLMRAMHTAFTASGGSLLRDHRVLRIEPLSKNFRVHTTQGVFEAAKVVIAAGHGVNALAPMVGLDVTVRPQRGQILVTERVQRLLPVAMSRFRQTGEGSIMLGESQEDVGYNDNTTIDVTTDIARHAVSAFPILAKARMVRTWAALRILSADKFPVYAESTRHPGAFVAVTHSGVTLAAVHSQCLAPWIAGGDAPDDFHAFSAKRFDVQTQQ